MDAASIERRCSIALHEAALRFARESDRWAAVIDERVFAAIDELDRSSAVTSAAATQASILAFTSLLRTTSPRSLELHPPPDETALVRAYVRRRMPLRVLLRAHQVGHAELWRAWMQIVREAGEEPEVELAVRDLSSEVLFHYVDQLMDELVRLHGREEQRWQRSMAAVREETVTAILNSAEVDLDAAERTLVHDLRGTQIGVVVWTQDTVHRADSLHAAWDALAARARAGTSVAVLAGSRVLWGWLATSSGAPDDLLPAPDDVPIPAGIRIAIGEPGKGLDGFRASHHQALHARRVAELAPSLHDAALLRYEDVAIAALLTAERALGEQFATRRLGPLAARDPVAARLRTTLEAYFAAQESPGATAQTLGVHMNTVLYRLRQAEELLGFHPAKRRLELTLALLLWRHLEGSS